MVGSATRYPEAVFLKRPDMTGFGFFFSGEPDFSAAVESFTTPILRSFAGEPVPGQPDPKEHLKIAAATLLGQAFDRSAPPEPPLYAPDPASAADDTKRGRPLISFPPGTLRRTDRKWRSGVSC